MGVRRVAVSSTDWLDDFTAQREADCGEAQCAQDDQTTVLLHPTPHRSWRQEVCSE
jgi:hypothetical protein